MNFDLNQRQSNPEEASLKAVRKGLSSLWVGSDNNIESTFRRGSDGNLEHLWVSAVSEGGQERFVYTNAISHDARNFNFIPSDIAEQISHLYEPIVRRARTLTEAMPDLYRVIEPALYVGFWRTCVGPSMFELPQGLKSSRPVSLMPSFEAFCEDPTLGRNLFAVSNGRFDVGVFISERDNYSLIALEEAVFKIPGGSVPFGTLRDFTFANASLLVDEAYEDFNRAVGQFRVMKTWTEAGGPFVMIASKRGEGAALMPFRA